MDRLPSAWHLSSVQNIYTKSNLHNFKVAQLSGIQFKRIVWSLTRAGSSHSAVLIRMQGDLRVHFYWGVKSTRSIYSSPQLDMKDLKGQEWASGKSLRKCLVLESVKHVFVGWELCLVTYPALNFFGLKSDQQTPILPSQPYHSCKTNYPFDFSSSVEHIVKYFLSLTSKIKKCEAVPNAPLVLFSLLVDALPGLLAVVKVLLGEHVELAVQPARLVPQ